MLLYNYIVGILVTTIISGIVISPVSAFHFNKIANYGVIGNLIAIPLMGVVIMPAAILSLLLMPFGLDVFSLAIMGWGIEKIIYISQYVSNLPNATTILPTPPLYAVLMIVSGIIWLCLWQYKCRLFGIIPIIIGASLFFYNNHPDILISSDSKLVAIRNDAGILVFNNLKSINFVSKVWLQNNGEKYNDGVIAKRVGWNCTENMCTANIKGKTIIVFKSKQMLADYCYNADIIIASFYSDEYCSNGTVIIDKYKLNYRGPLVIYITKNNILNIVSNSDFNDGYPWNQLYQNEWMF